MIRALIIAMMLSAAPAAAQKIAIPQNVTTSLSGLLQGNGSAVSAFGGTSCTNMFIRSLSSAGIATCAAVSLTADVTGTLGLARGGTNADLSATGGTSQFLKQGSAGAAITVVRPACADLSDAAASCATDATNATNIGSGTLSAARLPGTIADDTVMVGDSSSAITWRTLPNCTDSSGNHLNYTTATNSFSCGTSDSHVGTVTSVDLAVPGIFTLSGNPITTSGTITIAASGTSGGIPYFSGATTLASSAALTANLPVIGGGAGVAPTVGTRSGNTTAYVTTTGAQTSGDCVKIDANGNHIANGSACGGGGSSALSSITAAAASNIIASGNNTGQVWNWANTTDSTVAFTYGETSAATNGTSTSGVPNQVLLKAATVALSTQSPLSVYSRGNHVFSVSPTARQTLATDGTASAPPWAFASSTGNGMYLPGANRLGFSAGTSQMVMLDNFNFAVPMVQVSSGTTASPGLSDLTNHTSGLAWAAANSVSIVDSTDGEWVRFGSRTMQPSRGSADATAYAVNARKSRGTVASPTVITTGDDLLVVSGYGYVGATNTFREAARITLDSTGTIADATTGIGGQIVFSTTKAGTDSSVQEALRIQGGSVPQALAADGTAAAPMYSFASQTSGMYASGGAQLNWSIGGAQHMALIGNQLKVSTGSASSPQFADLSETSTGMFVISGGHLGFSANGTERARLTNTRQLQVSRGSADTTAFSVEGRKSRGTVASPTVITTGDDLLTVTGYGYVGAGNTYQDAAAIKFDSIGTISDATNGIGGVISFQTKKQGSNTTVIERAGISQEGHIESVAGVGNTPTMGSCGTSPSVTGTDNFMTVTVGTTMGTSCAVTFGSAYANAPPCHAQNDTDIVAYKVVTTTTTVTVTAAANITDSSKFHILCGGIR